jgi:hypothetical protein
LRLAEEDRHTGVIDDRAADFVAQSTRELIEDLSERYNSEPPSSGVETYVNNPNFAHASIVAIPARDQADELVGMMLAQLLQKAGATNVRALPIDTVENMLAQVERGQFAIACVSALPPFAVGQARSLCKRLHGRFPDLTVIVGLWGFAGGVPKAQERIGTACTDAVCTNFSEAFFQIQKLVETNGTGSTKQEQPAENAGATVKAGPRAIAS